jgi:UDP-N-acetylmuramate dehydrogenase
MTTLGIGGPARYFADITDTEALLAGVDWAGAQDVPLFVLGGGSNIVVADSGFPGLVLRVCIRGVETKLEGDFVELTAGAGEEWDPLVARSVANNWTGWECLSGIPGRVGATPIQNVGAYGQDTSETLVSVEALDLNDRKLVCLSAADCEFGYRTSRFKTRDRNRFAITRVRYRLKVGGAPAIRYAELQRHLAELNENAPTLTDIRKAVLAIRRRKAMVIDASDPDARSVGSFFVNPTVTVEEFSRMKSLSERWLNAGEEIPSYPAGDNLLKVPAGWLIEHAAIKRGYVHGKVGTSSKHALAIINRGGGTAKEILELKALIQSLVLERFGIDLTPEPVLIGF